MKELNDLPWDILNERERVIQLSQQLPPLVEFISKQTKLARWTPILLATYVNVIENSTKPEKLKRLKKLKKLNRLNRPEWFQPTPPWPAEAS